MFDAVIAFIMAYRELLFMCLVGLLALSVIMKGLKLFITIAIVFLILTILL